MQEIVDEVLKTEESAAKVVQEAREEASRLKTESEAEISESIKNARMTAQRLILDEVAHARENAEAEYKKAIKKIEENNAVFLDENEKKLASIVDKIITILINPEYEK
jgi:vacuolar-type H+-ATPase subunit H